MREDPQRYPRRFGTSSRPSLKRQGSRIQLLEGRSIPVVGIRIGRGGGGSQNANNGAGRLQSDGEKSKRTKGAHCAADATEGLTEGSD
jgi:hypothetical protein